MENLRRIVNDQEQLLRYFMLRDQMNSEIHHQAGEPFPNVRYSPITLTADRVLNYLWRELYGIDSAPLSMLTR